MAKLADALALGASGATHEGSSPFPPTNKKVQHFCWAFLFMLSGLEPKGEEVRCTSEFS